MESSEDEEESDGEDQEVDDVDAEFRRKIKEALGDAAAPSDNVLRCFF